MIRYLYNNYIKEKFFNKLMLTYAAITTLSLFTLSLIISGNASTILIERESAFNNQILESASKYIEQKNNEALSFLKHFYLDEYLREDLFNLLENRIDPFTSEYAEKKQKFDSNIMSIFSRDQDVEDIIIYKSIDGQSNIYLKDSNNYIMIDNDDYTNFISQISTRIKDSYGPQILPARYADYNNDSKKNVYSFAANIKAAESFKENTGMLIIDYDPDCIRKAYSEYEKNLKGYILILNTSGEIIFDSSEKYYGTRYPYLEKLKSSSTEVMLDEASIVNIRISSIPDIIVAGIIPRHQLLKSISALRRTILLVSLACIVMALLFSYIGMKVFSRRVKVIIDTMKKADDGSFPVKIPIKEHGDEISLIAISFNNMCDRLEEYINRVYISEIKQKNAELNALESQINPHFLYNTLEAIRMRALAYNNNDVSSMIYILANLFRDIVRNRNRVIRIKDEIEYCKLYLELFKIRYGEKLTVLFRINDDIMQYGMIKLLLQPIIENSIQHGTNPDHDNIIEISGNAHNRIIVISVKDNGTGIGEEVLHEIKRKLKEYKASNTDTIGLINVNERIKLIFGEQYGIDILSEKNKGTEVTLRIPAMTKEELDEYVQSIDS